MFDFKKILLNFLKDMKLDIEKDGGIATLDEAISRMEDNEER